MKIMPAFFCALFLFLCVIDGTETEGAVQNSPRFVAHLNENSQIQSHPPERWHRGGRGWRENWNGPPRGRRRRGGRGRGRGWGNNRGGDFDYDYIGPAPVPRRPRRPNPRRPLPPPPDPDYGDYDPGTYPRRPLGPRRPRPRRPNPYPRPDYGGDGGGRGWGEHGPRPRRGPYPESRGHTSEEEIMETCGTLLVGPRAPLNRMYSEMFTDHLYTIDPGRRTEAEILGYKFEKVVAEMAIQATDNGCRCLRKFHRLKNLVSNDHFYTIQESDVQKALTQGYVKDGPLLDLGGEKSYEGFCVPFHGACGAIVPIHRFYSEAAQDHFYTSDDANKVKATQELDYGDEGIECWAWPPPNWTPHRH